MKKCRICGMITLNIRNTPSGAHMFTHNSLVNTLVQTQPDPQAIGLVPMVVEQSGRGERAFDI
jgi:hypothetical protein